VRACWRVVRRVVRSSVEVVLVGFGGGSEFVMMLPVRRRRCLGVEVAMGMDVQDCLLEGRSSTSFDVASGSHKKICMSIPDRAAPKYSHLSPK